MVAEGARLVRIEERRLPGYARELERALGEMGPPAVDPGSHYLGRDEETVAFFLTLDAINFGSGYFPHLRKRPGMSGYFTVASSLTDRFEAHGPFSAVDLTRLGPDDCVRTFGQHPAAGPGLELMDLFAAALNELGGFLIRNFDGRFTGPLEAAAGSAESLVASLAEMPYFRDVGRYDGLEVPFYKRGQITAADLALAFGGEGFGRFHDLDRLTIFADNLVPHVLRVDGVLGYEEGLGSRIDRGEPIPAGSPEEVEIRACALHAVERLVAELRGHGRAVNAMRLDYLLWNRGRGARYKSLPRHRTRTVYY